MGRSFRSSLAWCKRYLSFTFAIIVAFVLFVLFFNDNSVVKSIQYSTRIAELKQQIRDNEDTLRYYEQLNLKLNTDPETMERIVRENYHMQRKNEDVYIVE